MTCKLFSTGFVFFTYYLIVDNHKLWATIHIFFILFLIHKIAMYKISATQKTPTTWLMRKQNKIMKYTLKKMVIWLKSQLKLIRFTLYLSCGCIQTLISEWQKLIFLWNCAKLNFFFFNIKISKLTEYFLHDKNSQNSLIFYIFLQVCIRKSKKVIYLTWQKVIYKSEYGHWLDPYRFFI